MRIQTGKMDPPKKRPESVGGQELVLSELRDRVALVLGCSVHAACLEPADVEPKRELAGGACCAMEILPLGFRIVRVHM